jgi:hypothetical protein
MDRKRSRDVGRHAAWRSAHRCHVDKNIMLKGPGQKGRPKDVPKALEGDQAHSAERVAENLQARGIRGDELYRG